MLQSHVKREETATVHSQLTVMYIYDFYLRDYKEIAMKIPSAFHDVSKNKLRLFRKMLSFALT